MNTGAEYDCSAPVLCSQVQNQVSQLSEYFLDNLTIIRFNKENNSLIFCQSIFPNDVSSDLYKPILIESRNRRGR
jgi:hypothetical protein